MQCDGLTISGNGTVDGSGALWWERYVVGDCGIARKPNASCPGRPKAFFIGQSSDILVEGVTSRNSPSWNFNLDQVGWFGEDRDQ